MKQVTVEVTCRRCGGTRWIPVPFVPLSDRGVKLGAPRDLRAPDGYTCLRCLAVLAGRNVQDPLPTDAQRERGRQTAAKRRDQRNPAARIDDLGEARLPDVPEDEGRSGALESTFGPVDDAQDAG